MGIHTGWKPLLKEIFPECWMNIPQDVKIQHIIDDWTIFFYSLMTATTGSGIVDNMTKRIEGVYTNNLELYSILFDEREYTPCAKQKTQMTRKENAEKYKGAKPFTIEEIKLNNITITNGILPDVERLKATSHLVHDVYRFCTEEIMTSNHNLIKALTIWVDGGRMRSKQDQFNLVPVEFKKHSDYSVNHGLVKSKIEIIESSHHIGETDLKIIKHINKSPAKNIIVRCKDGDVICILLLNMRNWMTTVNGKKTWTKRIYWTDDYGKGYLCVNDLWFKITKLFSSKYKESQYYIETMVALMLISGCDFIEYKYSLTPTAIWNFFTRGAKHGKAKPKENGATGYEVMFGDGLPLFTFKDESLTFGEPDRVKSFRITESKIRSFIKYWLIHFMNGENYTPRNIGKRKREESSIEDEMIYKEPKTKPDVDLSEIEEKNNSLMKGKFTVPDKYQLDAFIRRIYWTMNYWMNGYTERGPLNPVEIEPKTKLSKYGYERVEEVQEDGTVKKLVVFSERVANFAEK